MCLCIRAASALHAQPPGACVRSPTGGAARAFWNVYAHDLFHLTELACLFYFENAMLCNRGCGRVYFATASITVRTEPKKLVPEHRRARL